jgi:chromosome segregation ATPase
MSTVKSDITDLKSDMIGVKSDIMDLKSDMTAVKSDITNLKSDMSTVKSDIQDLRASQEHFNNDLQDVKSAVIRIENIHGEKLTALFDAREAQKDVNEKLIMALERIESKIEVLQLETAHMRRVK